MVLMLQVGSLVSCLAIPLRIVTILKAKVKYFTLFDGVL